MPPSTIMAAHRCGRILQRSGAKVIHLGHNRSVQEIVETAVSPMT
jgi:methylmalonyl-CoA mutase cobalamin-binding subunit